MSCFVTFPNAHIAQMACPAAHDYVGSHPGSHLTVIHRVRDHGFVNSVPYTPNHILDAKETYTNTNDDWFSSILNWAMNHPGVMLVAFLAVIILGMIVAIVSSRQPEPSNEDDTLPEEIDLPDTPGERQLV